MLKNIKKHNKEKGKFGENIAIQYLSQKNWPIIFKNFTCHFGEIDVIFQEDVEIVFAEVKTRMGIRYGFPAESVTKMKKEHILNSARYFLWETGLLNSAIRFDVIEVYLNNGKKPIIHHIKNVFW